MKDNNEQLKIGDKVKCLHMGSVYVGTIVGVSAIFIGTAEHTIMDIGISADERIRAHP